MHEDDKKSTKKHYNNRRRDYVDSFQWGFVDGNESEEKFDHPSQKTEKPVKPERKDSKDPGKKKPAAKPVVKPETAPVLSEETGFNVPSYGRTPIPTDEELKSIAKKRLDAPIIQQPSKTFRNPHSDKTSVEKVKPPKKSPVPEKRSPAVKPLEVKTEIKQDVQSPFPSEVLTRRMKKEQMVWDPERREYVPLDFSHKNSEQPPESEVVEVPVLPPKQKEKPVSKSASLKAVKTLPKTVTRERSQSKEPAVLPRKDITTETTSRQEKIEKTKKKPTAPQIQAVHEPLHSPPQHQKERSVTVPRGNVAPLKESSHPDPADIESESKGFAQLGVSETMLEALKTIRYLEPTPIQAGVFKQVHAGTDVMGQAQTGTGKTAAFLIPLIEGIEECPPGNDPVALILVPTRELAVQVRDEAIRLSYGRDVRTTACYGGKPLAKQIERLRHGIDIIVGTPGRILDLMNRRALSLDLLKWVVLDEADRMLDIGFRPDIEKILRRTPNDRQTLLFSATLPPPVVRLAERYMNTPEILDFSPKGVAVDTIEQFYITVDAERKFDALVHLLQQEEPRQAIIFTRTKRGADRLSRLLSRQLDSIAAIHGDLSQDQRDSVMGKFRKGTLRYLVATDVVGRGIDVSGISHIINYDIPAFCDDYVHRVGRTGRMGREGVAYTFVTVQEGSELTRIEMRIDKLLRRVELKGFETFTKPEPNFEEETLPASPTEVKPVYGKSVRRIRRAL